MIITTDELATYSGVKRTDTTLQEVYIESAGEIIDNYLGYDVETAERFTDDDGVVTLPGIVKLTALRIATLIQMEENNNLGVNSKSFGDSGTRTFLNVVDYSKYLAVLSPYRQIYDGEDE